MLELHNVSGGYGGETKLFDVSLSVPGHTVLSVIGPNGCGKSTLLRIMSGIQKPYSGSVLLDGTPIGNVGRNELAKRISYLPQGRNLPMISVGSLVLHGRFPYMGRPRRYGPEDRKIAGQAMDRTGILPLKHKEMARISGGERQKAYIAMLLAQDADAVLLDEPTTCLDIAHQLDIMRLARRMREDGKAVVMVLHDLNLALTYSDEVAVMRDGRIAARGGPEHIYESGILDTVFGVKTRARRVGGKTQYFFEPV